MSTSSGLPASEAVQRSVSIDGLLSGAGRLAWIDSGVGEDGPALATWSAGSGSTSIRAEIGSSLHAYGGGAVALGEGGFWFVNAGDGQIWRSSSASPLTCELRTLGDLSWVGLELLAIGENAAHDDLLAIDATTGQVRTLESASFLSSPRWHRNELAWVSWGSGEMPWDSSELWMAGYQPGKGLTDVTKVAGGPGISVTEPQWDPDGRLHYMSDETGWWNLYRWSPSAGPHPVAPMSADCAAAPWKHGYASYTFLPKGEIAMVAQSGPRHRLAVVDGGGRIREVPTPYTSIKPYLAECGGRIAMIAASPAHPQQIVLIGADGGSSCMVLGAAAGDADPAAISLPQHFGFDSDGFEVSISYYPSAIGAKPVATIVRAHPGPTYQSDLRLDWEIQYFTSRGFAVADVDYRGGTGFGRAFRSALNGRWGFADVHDCANAARHLVQLRKAQSDQLIIFGASAGGYTALRSACDPTTPFALAVARSPIIDPARWQQTAPRFQRAHAAVLAGPDAAIKPAAVCRPIALIHGEKDPIAAAGDTRRLVEALQDQGTYGVRYLELPDTGHFPSGRALVAALQFELAACEQVLCG